MKQIHYIAELPSCFPTHIKNIILYRDIQYLCMYSLSLIKFVASVEKKTFLFFSHSVLC